MSADLAIDELEANYLSNWNDLDLAQESDSSLEDEGDLIRTGNIPHKEWYAKELHDGYDVDGNRVVSRGFGDNIDQFLLSKNKQELKRTVYDPLNDRMSRLSDRDLSIINRLRKGKCATKMYDPMIPETFVFDITTTGVRRKSSFTLSKCDYQQILRNVHSIKNGWIRVDKYGEALRGAKEKKRLAMMRMDPYRLHLVGGSGGVLKQFDIWNKDLSIAIQPRQILSAPKARVPTTYESYNPPNEYLLSQSEKQRLLSVPDAKRNGRVVPCKYDRLRTVPQFDRFVHERFERCLDLYLLPRKVSKRSVVNPKDLLPRMPDISDLRPFPEVGSTEYVGHAQSVTSIDLSSCGQWLASASHDGTVRVFEVDSGREFFTHSFGKGHAVESVAFNPKPNRQSLLSVVCKHRCFLIPLSFVSSSAAHQQHVLDPLLNIKRRSLAAEEPQSSSSSSSNQMVIPRLNLTQTLALFKQNLFEELSHWPALIETMSTELRWNVHAKFKEIAQQIQQHAQKNRKADKEDGEEEEDEEEEAEPVQVNTNDISVAVRWSFLTFHSHKSNTVMGSYELINKHVVCISMLNYLSGIRWHHNGDYFATFRSERERAALIIHRFSKFESQIPFSKSIGSIQDIAWHPRKPLIYVACKQSIRCFNLEKSKMNERYNVTTNWITRLDLHPSALNMVVGGLDGKVCWYDMDLSHAPYKTFNFHSNFAVRNVQFHKHHKYSHLWATCADDGKIYIFYCKMFRDKFMDPILIPLNILTVNSSDKKQKHRFLDIQWHQTQPWIFAACSDGVIRKFVSK